MKPMNLFFIVLAALSLLSVSVSACGPCVSDADCLAGELCIPPGIGSSNWCCPPLGSWCDSNAACCWHSNATEWHCSWCHWNYSCTLGIAPHYATCQDHCTVHWGCVCMNCPPDLYTSCCTPFCEGHKQCNHYCNNPNFDACALGNLSGCCGGKECDCVIGACSATCLDGQTRPCSGINETWTAYCNGEHLIEYNGSGVNGSVTVTCNSTQTCSDCVWPSTCCDPPNATSKDWGLCDESMQSCTICCNATWNIGGGVDPTVCCGDDSGEHVVSCRENVTENACGVDIESCCPHPNDCIYNNQCYDSGWCHPSFRNIFCDSGTWRYDTVAPAITINLPANPTYEPDKTVNFSINEDHCDIVENTVTVKVNGTTWGNRHFDDLSVTFNGAGDCIGWEDYWSPYPNLDANSMSCQYDEPLIQPGLMTLEVCAGDAAGNRNCENVDFYYLALREIKGMCYRWNAISLPILPLDSFGNPDVNVTTTPILQGLPYDRLSRHRLADIFDSFAPEIPEVITQSLKELAVGKGYFIFINDTTRMPGGPLGCINKSYYGIPDPAGPELVMNSPGWYFFGIQSNSPLLNGTINDTLSDRGITSNEYTIIYYYDKGISPPYGGFVHYYPGDTNSAFDNFTLGRGYWINYTGFGDTLLLY